MTLTTISQADLAGKTQEVVDRVQHGEIAVVEMAWYRQGVRVAAPEVTAPPRKKSRRVTGVERRAAFWLTSPLEAFR
jgi:hypothetical protein